MSNHRYMINTISCCGNTMTGGLQENFKMKKMTPTSNLTWLQATTWKCNSGANVAGIWWGVHYKRYRIHFFFSFQRLFVHLDTTNSLGVMTFGSWTELLKLHCGQNWSSWEIRTFDPTSNVISGNIEYQLRTYLSQLSDGYPYASIRLMIEELWSLRVVSGCWKFGSGLNELTWVNQSVDHFRSGNSVNIENQHHRRFRQVSNRYLHALVG
jgi:hypothetical protein